MTYKKNWRTSVGGFLLAAGLALQNSHDDTLQLVGTGLSMLGGIVMGTQAKDKQVTGPSKSKI